MPFDRFVGLDLSLNGTGVAVLDRTDNRWAPPALTTIRLSSPGLVTKTYEAQRLVSVVTRLFDIGVFDPCVRLAAIEDYAYGIGRDRNGQSNTNCTFNLGELGGCVRYQLFTHQVPFC